MSALSEKLSSLFNGYILQFCTNCGQVNCPVKLDDGLLPHCYLNRRKKVELMNTIAAASLNLPESEIDSLDRFFVTVRCR